MNTSSSTKSVTITNHLSTALSLSSIPANGNCTVSVKFSPTVAGAVTGALTLTDSALTSPQSVTLTGTGR